jgi:hypothetical protein
MLSATHLDPIFPKYPPPITQNVYDKNITEEQLLGTWAAASVAYPECFSQIPDPNFPFRIPDPNFPSQIPDQG